MPACDASGQRTVAVLPLNTQSVSWSGPLAWMAPPYCPIRGDGDGALGETCEVCWSNRIEPPFNRSVISRDLIIFSKWNRGNFEKEKKVAWLLGLGLKVFNY